jgi:hypothetical protein
MAHQCAVIVQGVDKARENGGNLGMCIENNFINLYNYKSAKSLS